MLGAIRIACIVFMLAAFSVLGLDEARGQTVQDSNSNAAAEEPTENPIAKLAVDNRSAVAIEQPVQLTTGTPPSPDQIGTSSPAGDSSAKSVLVELANAFAWPLTVVVLAFLVAYNSRIGRLLGLSAKVVRKIKAAGVEMEINVDAVESVRRHLRDSFDELIANAREEYARMAYLMKLSHHLQAVMTEALPKILEEEGVVPQNGSAVLRGTVHADDVVFADFLYQIVDYFPRPTGAVGRRFSQRFGIIGRCWRQGKSIGADEAMTGSVSAQEALIVQWGMTQQEAQSNTRTHPAYLCVILKDQAEGDFPIGVLFIDSDTKHSFGTGDIPMKIAGKLERSKQVKALQSALSKAMAPLRAAAPNIDFANARL